MQLRALLFAFVLFVTGSTVRAEVEPEETPPQARTFYIRGLLGMAIHSRHSPILESSTGFAIGAEAGVGLFHWGGNSEFSTIGLGIHYDSYDYNALTDPQTQTNILGQILFMRNEGDFGAYFGPEVGIRSMQFLDGSFSASNLLVGFVGGVSIPLTSHLSYGPQFHLNGMTPLNVPRNGETQTETGIVYKINFAIAYHL